MKKLLSAFLAFVMVFGAVVTVFPITAEAAYTTPPTLTQSQVEAKINELVELLDGKYFTYTGEPCKKNGVIQGTNDKNAHGNCNGTQWDEYNNCYNKKIFTSDWFNDLFGFEKEKSLSIDQIPAHVYPSGNPGTNSGWTCHGFANFAMWYVFASCNEDKVSCDLFEVTTWNEENLKKYSKPGDVIRVKYKKSNGEYGGHSFLVCSLGEDKITILDCNALFADGCSCVREREIDYTQTKYYGGDIAISRASNYDVSSTGAFEDDAVAGEQWKVDRGTTNLRIRSGPSTSYKQVGLVTFGDTVTVTKTQDNWGYITYNGVSGWISLDYCTKLTTTKTQYRYYHYTDGKGNYSVCGGMNIENGKWKSSYREDTGWLDAPLEQVATEYRHVVQNYCSKRGCTDETWTGGKYVDANGVAWYREETRQVSSSVAVTGVTLNKASTTLTVGDSETLVATVAPSNATKKDVTWTSSNASVATVLNGAVIARSAGTSTITAKTADGNKTATCTVTVKAADAGESNKIILTIGNKTAKVFGVNKTNDVAPFIVNDRTMMPIRFISECLGIDVTWVNDERKVVLKSSSVEIVIYIDSDVAYVNGISKDLDSPAFIKDDRTFVPLRFISENFGATVEWDGAKSQVTIIK